VSRLSHIALLVVAGLALIASSGADAQSRRERAEAELRQQELRQAVVRFGKSAGDRVGEAAEELRLTTEDSEVRLLANDNLLAFWTEAINIGMGPHPEVNLFDMVVLVNLVRRTNEDFWQPEVYGPGGLPLVEAFRWAEARAWDLAAEYMSEEQVAELRRLIQRWRAENPNARFVEGTRFSDFAATFSSSPLAKADRPGFLLPEVGGATEAVDEVRLLTERLMIYLQSAPIIARFNLRGAYYEAALEPETQRLLGNVDDFVAGVNRFADIVQELPEDVVAAQRVAFDDLVEDISAEREAAIRQLGDLIALERQATFDELEASEPVLRALLDEMEQTLAVGNELAANLDRVTGRVEAIMAAGADDPDAEPSEPIDIADVRQMLFELSFATTQLNELTTSVERVLTTSANPETAEGLFAVVQALDTQAEGWIEYAFVLLLVLIVAIATSAVVSLLAYRYTSFKLLERLAQKDRKLRKKSAEAAAPDGPASDRAAADSAP